jgi:hypothetical protein
MALSRQELRQLAKTGAQVRIKELDSQRMALLREFPELNSSSRSATVTRATAGRPRRTRRTRRFTAAQRRAISQRMKRFWAERRKKNERKVA